MIKNKTRFALLLSLSVSFVTLLIKVVGYILTGSNTALSDAAESIIHVLAVSFVYYGLQLSTKPADDNHLYGHERIEFLSVGVEGTVIVIAGITIIYESLRNYILGHAISNLDIGIYAMGSAAVINFLLGSYVLKVGREEENMIVISNGKHTLTDVWTSAGVVATLLVIKFTGWMILDSIVSVLLAVYIMYEGFKLLKYSVGGLMDERDRKKDEVIKKLLSDNLPGSMIDCHNLRHRTTGQTTWIEFHATFKSDVSLEKAHDDATILERRLMDAIKGDAIVTIHLEPEGDHHGNHEILHGANKNRNFEDFI